MKSDEFCATLSAAYSALGSNDIGAAESFFFDLFAARKDDSQAVAGALAVVDCLLAREPGRSKRKQLAGRLQQLEKAALRATRHVASHSDWFSRALRAQALNRFRAWPLVLKPGTKAQLRVALKAAEEACGLCPFQFHYQDTRIRLLILRGETVAAWTVARWVDEQLPRFEPLQDVFADPAYRQWLADEAALPRETLGLPEPILERAQSVRVSGAEKSRPVDPLTDREREILVSARVGPDAWHRIRNSALFGLANDTGIPVSKLLQANFYQFQAGPATFANGDETWFLSEPTREVLGVWLDLYSAGPFEAFANPLLFPRWDGGPLTTGAARTVIAKLGGLIGQSTMGFRKLRGRSNRLPIEQMASGVWGLNAVDQPHNPAGSATLDLYGAHLSPQQLDALLSSPFCTRVTSLDLRDNALGDAGARKLAEAKALGNLKSLRLRDPTLTRAGAQALLNSRTWPGIEELEVRYDAEDRSQTIKSLGLRADAALEKLDLSGTKLSLDEIESLARADGFRKVRILRASGAELDAQKIEALGRASFIKNLDTIEMAHNPLGGDGLVALTTWSSPQLKKLDLSYCKISGRSSIRQLMNWRSMATVESLNLHYNMFYSAAGKGLLEGEFVCAALRHLDVGLNGMDDEFQTLIERCAKYPSLGHLVFMNQELVEY